VGGLPFATNDHAFKMIHAAFEITQFVTDSKNNNPLNHTRFEVRIGINSGPVVAGVVGTKKLRMIFGEIKHCISWKIIQNLVKLIYLKIP
jgi:class 3 adenylate cyclase